MKLVVAIIRQLKLEEVIEALTKNGVKGMTVTEIKGFGRQKGRTEHYRHTEYVADMLQKLKLEIAVEDSLVDKVRTAIMETTQSGKMGDGKIFILDIESACRIRTGECGNAALYRSQSSGL